MPRDRLPKVFMAFAESIADLSTCSRLQVGCVIVDPRGEQVLGFGYNGNAAGLANACDSAEAGSCGCFAAGTRIETARGRVAIQRVKVGDEVLTHEGRYRRVTQTFKHHHVGDLVMIDMESKPSSKGNNVARRKVATPEHPFLTRNGWVKIGAIQVGDEIAVLAKACDCGEPIPYYRDSCGVCARASSKPDGWRERARLRMTTNNPMGNAVKVYNPSKVAMMMRISGVQRGSTRRVFDEVQAVADDWRKLGYRCVVIDHCVRPDFIAIKDGLVIGVEVEKTPRRTTKYAGHQHVASQYDSIEWLLANRPVKYELFNNKFVWVRVTHTSRFKADQHVYNLEVDEDHSYVAQNAVVHNCVHAEANSLIKAGRGPKVAYVTDTPCLACAKLMINAGVTIVVAMREYRISDGVDIMKRAGVDVHVNPYVSTLAYIHKT